MRKQRRRSASRLHLLWLYSPICVGPCRKPRRPVFSQRGSFILLTWNRATCPVITEKSWSAAIQIITFSRQMSSRGARDLFLLTTNTMETAVSQRALSQCTAIWSAFNSIRAYSWSRATDSAVGVACVWFEVRSLTMVPDNAIVEVVSRSALYCAQASILTLNKLKFVW